MALRKTISPFFITCAIVASLLPLIARADTPSDLSVLPVVVDEKAKARDILQETVTITNHSARKLEIYPGVNDVKPLEGQAEFTEAQNGAQRSDSLANWVEISRGVVELNPNESKEIPFVIRVNLNAVAGTYHADISFYEGSNRADAEAKRPLSVVTVNTEVQADIKESMQLNKFITDSFFFSGDDVLFNYQLQNIGNQELKPKGEIRIYDRKGHEVASVPVNPDGKSFTPDQAAQLASAWTSAHGFGKFKAFLNIDYGNGSGSLQDTVFFWIIPWQQLLAIFVLSFIAIVVGALYFHRWLEHKHMQKFSLAGMGAGGAGAAAMHAPAAMLAPRPEPKSFTPVMPAVPKPAKKSLFSRFRRSKKISTDSLAIIPAPAVAPTSAAVSAPATAQSIPEPVQIARPQAQARVQSGAIDLSATSTLSSSAPRRNAGHVINLKDGS